MSKKLPADANKKALVAKNEQALATRGCKRHPNRALTEAQIRLLLHSIDNIRDDALIRLGLSTGLRVSEVISIRGSEIDFERGIIQIWDEKKDKWRHVMPTLETMSTIRKYLRSLPKAQQHMFPISAKRLSELFSAIPKRL